MKIITNPTVTVVGYSIFVEHPIYKIPADGDDHTKLGSFAAKSCYDSFGENGRSNTENQQAIMEHKHGSVLEHSSITLFVEGVTRGLSLESNRHRTFGISQRSTRYTAEEDAAIVLEPFQTELWNTVGQSFERQNDRWVNLGYFSVEAKCLLDFLNSCEDSFVAYEKQVHAFEILNPLGKSGFELRKWARGKARNVLPHALETRITYTNNHRGWRWFIEARSGIGAEPEIRRLADVVLQTLRTIAPLYYSDFVVSEVYDGIPVWTPQYSKV